MEKKVTNLLSLLLSEIRLDLLIERIDESHSIDEEGFSILLFPEGNYLTKFCFELFVSHQLSLSFRDNEEAGWKKEDGGRKEEGGREG